MPRALLMSALVWCALAPAPLFAKDIQTFLVISICGDGIVNSGEICDAGVGGNTGAYGSSTAQRVCGTDCLSYGPYCGDGILQVRFTEQCDDGNNTSGDLCAAQCIAEPPPSGTSGGGGAPTVGSTPPIAGGIQGALPAEAATKVVLRGKAYPLSEVTILLDGKRIGSTRADANADFVYSTTEVTPGIANFGFWAKDQSERESITTSTVFEVVQSAVTTVANVFLPPTIAVSDRQVTPGDLLTVTGQTVPRAQVSAEIRATEVSTLAAEANASGVWTLQLDTASLAEGFHAAKALFELSSSTKSGYGKSVNFLVGEGVPGGDVSSDLSGDGKVNLVDFSIFLLSWNTDDIRSDFNQDGRANLADFSIMLFAWTG